ncbi:MAG: hypothetical protein ABIP41_04935, partial [Croceibacterium sp.]
MILPLLSLLLTQAAAVPTLQQDRLVVCLTEARRDPASAIGSASAWLGETSGADRGGPQQCLGLA